MWLEIIISGTSFSTSISTHFELARVTVLGRVIDPTACRVVSKSDIGNIFASNGKCTAEVQI
jgi:hypothetical protein